MDGGRGGGYRPWQPGASPRGSRHGSPMQYFTSGSGQGYHQAQQGASPRFSTPRPNRYPSREQGQYNSPYPSHGGNRFSSPYGDRGGNRPLEYTPSPVRPRHNPGQYQGSPNSPHYNRGRGHSSFRGGRGGRGGYRHDENPHISAFFKKDMLTDPWEGMQPYLMEKTSFTTT